MYKVLAPILNKKIFYFRTKKSFSRKLRGHLGHFSSQTQKIKKIKKIHSENFFYIFLEKKFLYIEKWNFFVPSLKNSLCFSKKKIIFWEMVIFKKASYISGGKFQNLKNKINTLWKNFIVIFWEIKLSGFKLKKILHFFYKKFFFYFRRELGKPKKHISIKKFSSILWWMLINP